jgi:hypothetical protein
VVAGGYWRNRCRNSGPIDGHKTAEPREKNVSKNLSTNVSTKLGKRPFRLTFGLKRNKAIMSYRVLNFAGGLSAAPLLAAVLLLAVPAGGNSPALAQNNDAKPADQQATPSKEGAKDNNGKDVQKVDEFTEAQAALNGPAGNPECVWLGRRVVSLLWRDDLDTAFRHLDLYDRFGCPSGHIQVTFRCLVLHSNTIDPKAADSLNGRVHACWINPSLPPAPAPAASAQNPTATH